MDVTRSLARLSLVVAAVAALVDSMQLVLCGAFGAAPVLASILFAAVVAADLALAAPPATAALAAVGQVAVKVGIAGFVNHYGLPAKMPDVGFLVVGYRAGAWLGGTTSFVTVAMLAGAAAVSNVLVGGPVSRDWRWVLMAVAAGVVPWLVGRYTAARGAYIAELEQRERLRQQEQRAALDRALADERAAIARDLHDVISHHVSAIGIHAGVARMALSRVDPAVPDADSALSRTDAQAAARSLTAVETSSRAAMVDLRRQLDLLHGREDDGQRQPGLVDIDDLVERVRAAGLAVRVEISGEPPMLPESLDVMLYRVVQEILTNALRHGREPARLEIGYRPTRVEVRGTNPIASAALAQEGVHRGLDGIRRRAELFGGTAQFGPDRTGGRWDIVVSVPIGAA
ncbi:MAG: Histidine kinase [Nocardia sp.]|uniref:sensor histidine kinase n=1 Tax=Nocardia sp. TaxID=1821 RepID=UPI0026235AC0|nr:histidine kinase [Nocardia sp.]MCU1643583.1 Histidine kinase [Nocardia sp.]